MREQLSALAASLLLPRFSQCAPQPPALVGRPDSGHRLFGEYAQVACVDQALVTGDQRDLKHVASSRTLPGQR